MYLCSQSQQNRASKRSTGMRSCWRWVFLCGTTYYLSDIITQQCFASVWNSNYDIDINAHFTYIILNSFALAACTYTGIMLSALVMDILKSEFFWNDLQLLSKTLATIDDDKWVCQLAAEATRYLSTYNNDLEEKVSVFNSFYFTHNCQNKLI